MDVIQSVFSKLLYSELGIVFPKLRSVQYAVIKGEPLSNLIYGRPYMRKSTDVDILIDKHDLDIVKNILQDAGFYSKKINREDRIVSILYSHQTPPFINKTNIANLTVDLNFDLFWGEYRGKRIDINEFLNDSIEMSICGYNVKTLSPIKAAIQLILHHYKEMNSIYHLATHNSINQYMFKDIYFLIKNNSETITVERMLELGGKYEILPFMYYIFYYTNQIYKDEKLSEFVTAFETSEGKALLPYYGLEEKEKKLWNIDFFTRLNSNNTFDLIKGALTDYDKEKLERSTRVFG